MLPTKFRPQPQQNVPPPFRESPSGIEPVWQRHNQLVVPHELVLRNLADFGQISAKDAAGFQASVDSQIPQLIDTSNPAIN